MVLLVFLSVLGLQVWNVLSARDRRNFREWAFQGWYVKRFSFSPEREKWWKIWPGTEKHIFLARAFWGWITVHHDPLLTFLFCVKLFGILEEEKLRAQSSGEEWNIMSPLLCSVPFIVRSAVIGAEIGSAWGFSRRERVTAVETKILSKRTESRQKNSGLAVTWSFKWRVWIGACWGETWWICTDRLQQEEAVIHRHHTGDYL